MPQPYLCLIKSHKAIVFMPYEFDLSSDESAYELGSLSGTKLPAA
jgi:hypothetical protein